MNNLRTFASRYGMAFVLLALIILFASLSDVFLTGENLTNILRQVSMLGIASVGATLVILTGGIDLSVGSAVALTGVVSAIAMTQFGWGALAASLLGIACAGGVGVVNGVAVTRFSIPPLIATLATLTAVRGLAYILSGGLPIFGFPHSFGFMGRGMIGVVPVPVIVMIVAMVLGWLILNRTRYGRHLYAVGGNAEAARLAGIRVSRNLLMTYIVSGLFTGVAGVIMLSRLNSAQPNTGTGFEMDVVTAVVLGGISIAGGEGRFMGVVFGVFVIGVLSNGMTLLNVQDYYQLVIKGAVLMFAVGLDQYYVRASQTASRRSQAAAILQPRETPVAETRKQHS
ncbi:ABC transporter permease [Paraburkholderia acidisoli]|uniref:Ribose ABC transporter permease n=1 Tax=Paraburkholderia acidisoli TaxID=2571748 RepID=A0A7Z2JHN9_9BURK|nr:ABC transporter permease [Paraburkholderia acidisoli]QGZ64283.1 ribose ABC transporter permease [Paraburkholderia acidisoli]